LPAGTSNTIVSVTPIAVERDSRTLKQAVSLGRFGYRSVVVEGEASGWQRDEFPFELVTVPGALPAWGSEEEATGTGEAPASITTPPAPRGLVARAWPVALKHWDRLRITLKMRTAAFRWNLGWNVRTYRALPKAQLYIVHSYVLSPAVVVKGALSRTPIAYDAHDSYFEIAPEQHSEPTRGQRLWELIERACVRRARRFVTVSQGVAVMLEERFSRRPDVIRNCHDLRLDHHAARDLREQIGIPEDHFLLVSIGNYKAGMNVGQSLEALSALPDDVHIAFVGRGHERNVGRIAELGLERRVHLVGSVLPTEVTDFVRGADAAAVLYRPLTRSYASALPNGFFQGVAAGLPTLYPEGLPELAALAESHELGLPIDQDDPESIAAGVSRLREDLGLRRRLRANAARASEVENWEHEEGRFRRLIESAMDGTVPAAPRSPTTAG
jgi:glycosyltransferase involved in cell wall biosynthesis